MTLTNVQGTDLYYEEEGDGIPILLIHPAGSTASTWGAAADDLARVGRVVAYDRRGYRRSGGDPVRSIRAHTDDAAALLGALRAPPAVVVGTSIGATIAIDLALRRPDLVRAVVAHESPWRVTRQPPTPSQVAALARMEWLSSRGRHSDAAAVFLRFAYTYRDGGSAWDAFPEEWRQTVSENAQAALTDIRIAISGYPSRKELAEITTPVVCSHGARSARTMVRVTRALARAIPSANVRDIEGAGHAPAFDAPDKLRAGHHRRNPDNVSVSQLDPGLALRRRRLCQPGTVPTTDHARAVSPNGPSANPRRRRSASRTPARSSSPSDLQNAPAGPTPVGNGDLTTSCDRQRRTPHRRTATPRHQPRPPRSRAGAPARPQRTALMGPPPKRSPPRRAAPVLASAPGPHPTSIARIPGSTPTKSINAVASSWL